MKFTYYGHSCFMVEIIGKKILFDPFITPNDKAKHIDISTIIPDYIAISHGHFDHVFDVETIAKQSNATIIANWEIADWFTKKGIAKCHPMNIGGKWNFDFGTIKCVVAQHSSSLPDGSYGGNPMGFLVESTEGNFYYGGDTALTLDMQLLPLWAKLDFAILPIGDVYTMDTMDAIKASDFIKCDKIIGVHYDTFGYIVIDAAEAKKKFEQKEKELILLSIGEQIDI